MSTSENTPNPYHDAPPRPSGPYDGPTSEGIAWMQYALHWERVGRDLGLGGRIGKDAEQELIRLVREAHGDTT